jgi:PAS domain S-box-containing protein
LYNPENKTPYAVFALFRDITEEKNFEEALVKEKNKLLNSEIYLKQLLNGMPIAVYTTDKEGKILFYNHAAVKLWGREPNLNECKWTGAIEVYDKKGRKVLEEDLPVRKSILEKKEIYAEEFLIKNLTGYSNILIYSIPLLDDSDNVIGGMNVSVDITEQKQIQQEVFINEKKFRATFEEAGVGMYLADEKGYYLQVNDSFARMLGYTKEEMVGINFLDTIFEEDRNKDLDLLNGLISKDYENFQLEKRYHHKNGSLIWCDLTVSVVRDSNDKIKFFIAQAQNISDRKKAEQIILDSNFKLKKLETFINSSIDAIQVSDEKGKLIYLNQVASSRLGIPQELEKDYFVKDFDLYINTNEDWQKHIEELKNKSYLIIETQNKNLFTNEIFEVEVNLRYIIIDSIGYVIAISRDISQRKIMESEIEKLSLIARLTSNAVVVTNEKREIIWVNNAYTQITGYTLEESFGKQPGKFLQTKDTDLDTIQSMSSKLSQSEPVRCEILNQDKKGRKYWVDLDIQPIFKNNKLIGFIALQIDITERKKFQLEIEANNKRLELINKELEQFAYIASHDLQEPLRTLISCVDLLKLENESYLNTHEAKMLNFIVSSANRMRDLVKGLMEYSRIGKERVFVSINLNELIQEVLQDLSMAIEENNAEINVFSIPQTIKGSKIELRLLFQNLINNGIKFRKKGSRASVHISATENKQDWVFKIQDNESVAKQIDIGEN